MKSPLGRDELALIGEEQDVSLPVMRALGMKVRNVLRAADP